MDIILIIAICMLLACILGFFIGRSFCKNDWDRKLEETNSEWQTKHNHLVHERDELKAKIGAISKLTTERDELSTKLRQLDNIENERDNLTASLAALETEDWPSRYSSLETERNQLAAQLKTRNTQTTGSPKLESKLADTEKARDELLGQISNLETQNATSQAALSKSEIDTESDYEIEEVEGIGKGYGKQLREMGIARTSDLISKCSTLADIKPIAETMKLEEWVISSWTSMADLCRVKGVGGQFAELLDFSGVHSTQQLATSNAHGLLVKLNETNEKEHRVNKVPAEDVVANWIENAKTLEALIHFDS